MSAFGHPRHNLNRFPDPARKQRPVKRPPQRGLLRLEALEDRVTPTTFDFLDTFDGAILSSSGGTGPTPPFNVGIGAIMSSPNSTGTESSLQTGGVSNFVGTPNPTQVANTRQVDITFMDGTGAVTATTFTGSSNLTYSSDNATMGTMVVTYDGISSTPAGPIVLSESSVRFTYDSDAATEDTTVSLEINGVSIGASQSLTGNADDAMMEFDAQSMLGQIIDTIEFTFVATTAADFDIHDIDIDFSTIDATIDIYPDATNEVGDEHVFRAKVQVDDGDGNGLENASGERVLFVIENEGTDAVLDDSEDENGDGVYNNDEYAYTNANGVASITINSSKAGQVTTNAYLEVLVDDTTLVRDTDPMTVEVVSGPDTEDYFGKPAVKTYVDAKIDIFPDDTNEVGDQHIFKAVVMVNDGLAADEGGDGRDGFAPAPNGTPVTFTIENAYGASADAGTYTVNTDNGMASITINSDTAGQVIANASVEWTYGDLTLERDTDPNTQAESGPNTYDPYGESAVKKYIDAKIDIYPDETNEVGDYHVFTAVVSLNEGSGFVRAPEGTPVTFTIQNAYGASADAGTYTVNTDANGEASITINSDTAGQVIANARVTWTYDDVTLTRDTDPNTQAESGPNTYDPYGESAVKKYIDAKIDIDPNLAFNQVGDEHTFVATVQVNDGQGGGFQRVEGLQVLFVIENDGTDAVLDASADENNDGIYDNDEYATTDGNGQARVTINSDSAGQVTANARVTWTYDDVTLVRDTDPNTQAESGPNTYDPYGESAVKKYIDAKIDIYPDETNEVGDYHVFTAVVSLNEGSGFVRAPEGTPVTFTIENVYGASANAGTYTVNTNDDGEASININSNTAGQVIANASVMWTYGGVTMVRDTLPNTTAVSGPDTYDPHGEPAVKTYVDAKIDIDPNEALNLVGDEHTFVATVHVNDGQGGGFVPASGERVLFVIENEGTDAVLDDSADENGDGNFANDEYATTDVNGQAMVTINSSTAGRVTANAFVELTIDDTTVVRDTNPNTQDESGPNTNDPYGQPAIKDYEAPVDKGFEKPEIVLPHDRTFEDGPALILKDNHLFVILTDAHDSLGFEGAYGDVSGESGFFVSGNFLHRTDLFIDLNGDNVSDEEGLSRNERMNRRPILIDGLVTNIIILTGMGDDMIGQRPGFGDFDPDRSDDFAKLVTQIEDTGGNSCFDLGDGFNIVCTKEGFDNIRTSSKSTNYIDVGNGGSNINTGNGNDTIVAGNGFDNISTAGGHDCIDVGNGGSCFDAGSGNDSVTAREGYDGGSLGDGDDYFNGGNGGSCVMGGNGDDTMIGGNGRDDFGGNDGNDVLLGLGSQDFLKGGSGIDVMIGGDGEDIFFSRDGFTDYMADGNVVGAEGEELITKLANLDFSGLTFPSDTDRDTFHSEDTDVIVSGSNDLIG